MKLSLTNDSMSEDELVNSKNVTNPKINNCNKSTNSSKLLKVYSGQNSVCKSKIEFNRRTTKDSLTCTSKDQSQIKLRTKPREESFAAYVEAFKRAEKLSKQTTNSTKERSNTYMKTTKYPVQPYYPAYVPSSIIPIQPVTMYSVPLLGELLTGHLKFFDAAQNYGFFVVDKDGTDLFVHYEEFSKAGMTLESISMAKSLGLKFIFRRMTYYGKYDLSYKAVNIQIIYHKI